MDLRSASAAPKASDAEVTPRERSFEMRYRAPDGTQHVGRLTSRVLTAQQRREAGRIAALQAGAPWEQLPAATREEIFATNIVARQLLEPRPTWFDSWAAEDVDLLFAAYAVCVEHTQAFFRGYPGQGGSDEGEARVAVVALDADGKPLR